MSNYCLKEIQEPVRDCTLQPVFLSDETMEERKAKVLSKMKDKGIDTLVVYGDVEHGSNYEYLVGYVTRFEESLLVLHSTGEAYLVLGNENLNKAGKARIKAEPILCSYFSLPNQPMQNPEPFVEIIRKAKIAGKKVGIAGWKLFTSKFEDNEQLYDVPHFIVNAIKDICGKDNVKNVTDIFIGREGVRMSCNANEIAHYEFAASLSGDAILDALDGLKVGVSEFEIGDKLARYGQYNSIVTIAAFGPRFIKANMYPTANTLKLGDSISLTNGYKGGSNSRSCIGVESEDQLPEEQKDYLDKVVYPYFNAICTWLGNIKVGSVGGDIYNLVDKVLPRSEYGWYLCPGHTTAEEEWMSSPIYENSKDPICNGMMMQTDIIPSVKGYNGISVESCCVIANKQLQDGIKNQYPEMYERMMARRQYIEEVQGIELSEDVLPLCSEMVYMRPLALSKKAVVKQ